MSVIARLEVVPTREQHMSDAVARAVDALDDFDVSYEVTPTDTVIEAADVGEVFAAAEAAHRAVNDERVVTSLEVDEQPGRLQGRDDRVASVERELGRPARRENPTIEGGRVRGTERGRAAQTASESGGTEGGRPQRYGGSRGSRPRSGETQNRESRYLGTQQPTQR